MFLSKPATIQPFPCLLNGGSSDPLPLINLADTDSNNNLTVKACEEFGFFKVINHGVPLHFISCLESEAIKFFSLPLPEKERAGPLNPFGYGNKKIGPSGDVGWIEYLLLTTNPEFDTCQLPLVFRENQEKFRGALNDYVTAVRNMGCEILGLMADGLKIQQRNAFSKLLKDKQSDFVFRINHYPPRTEVDPALNGRGVIGFGEHTDPHIISILRSNSASGCQIQRRRDGSWISVPPDESSFFVNVGESLQVMTNVRFRSVKHRVMTNGKESRMSMVYFGGPPLSERIAPLPSLMRGNESLYKEFTWFEYKKSAYGSRLSDNRLQSFERMAAS